MEVGQMTGETGWGSVRFDCAGSDDALSAAAQSAERETWHGEIWSQAKLPEAPMRRASGASQCCRAVDCDLGMAGMLAQGVLRLYLQDTKLAGRKVNRRWLTGGVVLI